MRPTSVQRLVVLRVLAAAFALTIASSATASAEVLLEMEGRAPAFPNNLQPGRAEPAKSAEPAAYFLEWDTYKSLIVIGEGSGRLRPAWVVTYEPLPGGKGEQYIVAYRAKASRDQDGVIHIDARKAIIVGPKIRGWSPDSFAFTADQQVYTLDDRLSGNTGKITETVARDTAQYEKLLSLAQMIVNESG
jgi:hypothetical protein